MNEEELRAEVTRLTNENKSPTDKYNTLNEQIKTKDEEIRKDFYIQIKKLIKSFNSVVINQEINTKIISTPKAFGFWGTYYIKYCHLFSSSIK